MDLGPQLPVLLKINDIVFVGLVINFFSYAAARCWMLDRCCNFSSYTLERI